MRQAACMLIIKDGLILSISRRNDPTKFGLPGGKVDDNETIMQAAIRECFEETNVIVTSTGCAFIFRREEPKLTPDGEDFYSHCYYAEEWSGDIKDSEEGKVLWLTKDQLISQEMGAFPVYNKQALDAFKLQFPYVYIK